MSILKNKTILITGASSGLGEEFARQLASDGNTLILVARRADRLKKIQKSLSGKTARIEVIVQDLSQNGAAEKVFKQTQKMKLPVDVLLNNAGYGYHGDFLEQTVADAEQLVRLNCGTLTALTRVFAAPMVKRGSGLIMNVASVQGFLVLPFYTVYSATKAFVVSFSGALGAELAGTGVDVLCVCPGYTATEFAAVADASDKRAKAMLGEMSAKDVVAFALNKIGRGRYAVPGLRNRLMIISSQFSPRALSGWIARWLLKPMP